MVGQLINDKLGRFEKKQSSFNLKKAEHFFLSNFHNKFSAGGKTTKLLPA
jgi:hypothetical protein